MNQESNSKRLDLIKPKKILIKRDKQRQFFDSLDISYPLQLEDKKIKSELLLQNNDKNNDASDDVN